ncbi:MAG: hypothetical protein N5P05_000513 [Chroococcopsis gigantea SAG 12.99]|jgi:hypothetical protein|nr:hypothetical protein [Chlorogloea purpurea SAG 13.99]MDV2998907.1 hypothetical protein [Chroococcopsis gigantea SAG 12.99]
MAHQELKARTERLHQLRVYGRWGLVLLSWLVIVPWSLWALREDISLLKTYFTWASLRYTIIYNFWPVAGLAYCLAITVSSLLWQGRNIIWGIPAKERQQLENGVERIQRAGPSHPLWRWIIQK